MKSMLKSLMSVAVAALAFTSCSNDATEEVIPNGGSKTLVVNATIDQTRTVMADNHVNLEWATNDQIYLYIGEKAAKADVKKINPVSGGTITGVTYENGNKVYANYSLDNSYSDGVTKAEIKIDNEQTQTAANVFAGENLPMVAKGEIIDGKVDLTFNPVGCVLVFNVYGKAYNSNEQIKSIKFETSVGCCGYQKCDLTAGSLGYKAYDGNKSVTVTLTTPATIGVSKPSDTKKGENQVYMVVAPVNYEAATITVNTTIDPQKGDIYNTYTFTTPSGIDCSQYTARVVNLNLANAAVVPSIDVPTVPQQESTVNDDLVIEGIQFKNIETAGLDPETVVGVYSDKELTNQDNVAWLTITNNADLFSVGKLYCSIAANADTTPRTAYIGIKCGDVQAAIPVTQVAPGASTDKYYVKVTETLDDWTGTYMIVHEDAVEPRAYNGSLSDNSIGKGGSTIEVTITGQGILSTETINASSFIITKSGDGYLLQAASGIYIYVTTSKTGLSVSTTPSTASSHYNLISIEGNGETYAHIQSTHGPVMRYNPNGGNPLIKFYGSTSYSGMEVIQLYKLQE